MKFLVLAMMLAVMASSTEGQGTCGNTFFMSLVQLMPCRAAVSPFSPIPPSEACCYAVKSIGQSCLCALANGPPITRVDRNIALLLPEKCAANFEPCDIKK